MAEHMDEDALEQQRYFRAVEDAFIELRGAPFLLSPSDWRIARDWYRDGIPLEVVVGALAELFARRAERGATSTVNGLRYCASGVAEAWKARRELGELAPAPEQYAIEVEERLARLADALPADLLDRSSWQDRVRGVGVDAARAEAGLASLDRELLTTCLEALTPGVRGALEAEVEGSIASLAERVDEQTLTANKGRLLRDAVRRHAGLPLLSIFAPEAMG